MHVNGPAPAAAADSSARSAAHFERPPSMSTTLAVTTLKRHAGMPEVPALAETLAGFETVAWFGVLAPVGTPKIIVDRMNKEVNEVLLQADVRERLANLGCDPAGSTPEVFASRINGEVARWKKLAAEKNIRAD